MNTDLRRHGMSPSSIPRGIHTQLVYGNVISSEIATAKQRKEIESKEYEVRVLFSQVHAGTSVQFKEQWKFTLSLELAQTKSMLETLHAIA